MIHLYAQAPNNQAVHLMLLPKKVMVVYVNRLEYSKYSYNDEGRGLAHNREIIRTSRCAWIRCHFPQALNCVKQLGQ